MRLLQAKFGGVFNRQHAFARIDHLRQGIEHGRFTRTRTSRDDDVHPASPRNFQHSGHAFAHRSKALEHIDGNRLFGEFTNRDRGAAKRQRRHDDVDAAAVLQTGVGAELKISRNVGLRLEYLRTDFDRQTLDHLVLADDDFFELIAEAAVNLAEFINGGDVVGGQGGG